MKILVTEPEYFDKDVLDELRKLGRVKARRLTRAKLERELENTDVIVVRVETILDRQLLERAKKLRIIGSVTTGLNHIDVEYAKQKGIEIVNLQGMHTIPTAEHTMALILGLSRRIPWAHISLNKGVWKRHRFIGTQLSGKTLGIIGFGRIGRQVADYAKAFGMNIIAYDPYVKAENTRMVGLEELIKTSDMITLHTELTKETESMIGYEQFQKMKRGALLINAARSKLIDSRALLDALQNGTIAGAAIDVFDSEPLTDKNHPLIKYAKSNSNLLLTPHIAASTHEAAHNAGMDIAKQIAEKLS